MPDIPTLRDLAHRGGELLTAPASGRIDTFPVETAGGVFQVRFDPALPVSGLGGAIPFAQFLQASGLFAAGVEDAPWAPGSNRAHAVRDVLGTVLLSVLSGHYRFAHVTALRGDLVVPQVLGMEQVVSEDTLWRAMKMMMVTGEDRCAQTESWLGRPISRTHATRPRFARPRQYVCRLYVIRPVHNTHLTTSAPPSATALQRP